MCTDKFCPADPIDRSYTIAKNVYGSSYSWSVGKVLDTYGTGNTAPDGSYTIQVCQTGSTICDSSDSYFKIVSSSTQPSITVTSPQNNSALTTGQVATISWNTTGSGFDKYQIIVGNSITNSY